MSKKKSALVPLVPPSSYEALIEGQPPGGYPGFVHRVHLVDRWPGEFALAQRYFRVVGFAEALHRNKLSLRTIRRPVFNDSYERMLELVPAGWKDHLFEEAFSTGLRHAQIGDAATGHLQRFDRAALSVLFLLAVFERLEIDWPMFRCVRLRPVTYYIEGFDDYLLGPLRNNSRVMEKLRDETAQPISVIEKMADGHWFVTRKTADLTVRALTELENDGVLGTGTTSRLSVRCGRSRIRPATRRTIWPVVEEEIHYFPDEYLSPAAWQAIPAAEQSGIKEPPFARDQAA